MLPLNPVEKESNEDFFNRSKGSSIDQEERKNYHQRKNVVQATDFDGSDNEVYIESECSDGLRDDLSMSETGYDDQEDQDSNEEERERQFFGAEDYTLLSRPPPEEEVFS
jgi:hypothetical protein